jgi:hypothetical protein
MSDFYGNKTQAAFLFSYDRLREISDRLYFWTFTGNTACTDLQFTHAWHLFLRRLNKNYYGELFGLRVFERHPGDGERSGLLHCHCVVNLRLAIDVVKRLAVGSGIGRVMWVNESWDGLDGYLSKYLTKEHKLGHRIRSWAKFGYWDHCRVGSVVMESHEADLFRFTYLMFKGQKGAWAKTRAEVERIKTQLGLRDASLVVNGIAMPEPVPEITPIFDKTAHPMSGDNPF